MNLQQILAQHRNVYSSQSLPSLPLTASFVIPTFNSALSLPAVIASIDQLENKASIKEIIIIEDGSTDSTLAVIEQLCLQYPGLPLVVHLNKSRRYAAHSRNRGIEQASGDLICFIDSDIILPADYLSRHLELHQKGACISFSLRCNISSPEEAVFPAQNAHGDFRAKLLETTGDNLETAPFSFCPTHTLAELCLTCAVTYRRTDLITVKGCPENFIGWGFNDTAMAAKVIALGRPVMLANDCIAYHLEHPPRSGRTAKKWAEYARNRERYQRLLSLPPAATYQYWIDTLEGKKTHDNHRSPAS